MTAEKGCVIYPKSKDMFLKILLSDPVFFFRVVVIVILSISLHELAHGIVAISQGDDTPKKSGHLTLNPVVHMGWESLIFLCLAGIAWGQMPVNPSKFRSPKLGNILVSAAGPLCNLALGILCIVIIKLLDITTFGNFVSMEFINIAAQTNLMLFLFNLLPIPPLDGFHVFSEIFPTLKTLEKSLIGFFLLMILFVSPEFGDGLAAAANLIIQSVL